MSADLCPKCGAKTEDDAPDGTWRYRYCIDCDWYRKLGRVHVEALPRPLPASPPPVIKPITNPKAVKPRTKPQHRPAVDPKICPNCYKTIRMMSWHEPEICAAIQASLLMGNLA